MTSIAALIALFVAPIFLLYSPRIEQQRVITINKPLVITQERRSPAYYLYQQAKEVERVQQPPAVVTTYLNGQDVTPSANEEAVVTEAKSTAVVATLASAAAVAVSAKEPAPIEQTTQAGPPVVATHVSSPPIKKNESSAKSNNVAAVVDGRAKVQGKFETRGIGVIDQVIEIKRIEEGQVREVGKVDLSAGLYSIDVKSTRGVLVAQIKDRNGILLGEDQQKIINLQNRGTYLEGPFMQVRPPATLGGNPSLPRGRSKAWQKTAMFSAKKPTPGPKFVTTLFSNQLALENPTDEYGNVALNSSTIMSVEMVNEENGLKEAEATSYRKTISIRQPGDKHETPVFSQLWASGMIEYISDQQKIEFKSKQVSLVIGRVQIDGQPVAGAQVQIENHPGVYPVYLDSLMIPVMQATETTASGYFVFVGLEDDIYTITAFKQNRILGHQMFVAEKNAISYQLIQSTLVSQKMIVRTFDAFNGQAMTADLIVPDLEEVLTTDDLDGLASYMRFSEAGGVSEFLVRTTSNSPNNYLPVRYFQNSKKDYLHIPMISEEWLKKLQVSLQVNDEPKTGVFIGFVPDMSYDVYLVIEGYDKNQIAYFDAEGRLVPSPVSGGGFVLFNVPVEAHEVIVQEVGSDRIHSQVIRMNENQVSVAHF